MTGLLDALGRLFTYPDGSPAVRADAALLEVGDAPPDVAAALTRCRDRLRTLAPDEAEELYTRTFDLNPVCCLEVGYHLWGDRYDRGDFLVCIRGLLREHGVAENGELPDHLSHVLPLLGRVEPATGSELIERVLRPALGKMLEALEDRENPWRDALSAVAAALPGPVPAAAPGGGPR